jgi:hypothetical protein
LKRDVWRAFFFLPFYLSDNKKEWESKIMQTQEEIMAKQQDKTKKKTYKEGRKTKGTG